MNHLDLHNLATVTAPLPAQTITSTATGTGVDVSAYIGRGKLTLNATKASAGTSPTLDVKVQDSASSGSGYADVTGYTFTRVTDADDLLESIAIDFRSVKKYIRVIATVGGSNTPTFALGVTLAGVKQVI